MPTFIATNSTPKDWCLTVIFLFGVLGSSWLFGIRPNMTKKDTLNGLRTYFCLFKPLSRAFSRCGSLTLHVLCAFLTTPHGVAEKVGQKLEKSAKFAGPTNFWTFGRTQKRWRGDKEFVPNTNNFKQLQHELWSWGSHGANKLCQLWATFCNFTGSSLNSIEATYPNCYLSGDC